MKEIDNYMTPAEAAYRWGISVETIKERLKPSRTSNIEELIDRGLAKQFKKPGGKRGSWILTREVMKMWYGEENKNNFN